MFKILNLSIQTLIEEFKVVVIKKDISEYRDMCMFITFLPLLTDHPSHSNAINKIYVIEKRTSRLM